MPERLEWLTPDEPSPAVAQKPSGERLDWLSPSKQETKNVGDIPKAGSLAPAVSSPEMKAKLLAAGGYDKDVDYGFSAEGIPPAPGLGEPGYEKKGISLDTMFKERPHSSLSEKATAIKEGVVDEWK